MRGDQGRVQIAGRPVCGVVPYASCESEALLVVQVIVAPDAVMADTVVSETVRGATSERVVGLDDPFKRGRDCGGLVREQALRRWR